MEGGSVVGTGGVSRAYPRGVLVSRDATAGSFFVAYLIAGLPGARQSGYVHLDGASTSVAQ